MRALIRSLAFFSCGALIAYGAQNVPGAAEMAAHAATRVAGAKETVPQPGSPPSLAPMLKRVSPAVVNISVQGVMEDENPLLKDPNFRRFFHLPDHEKPILKHVQAVGSGVIFDAARGFVLTNSHVIEHGNKIVVTLHDKRQFQAKLVASDPATDIAVLRIPPDDLTQIALGNAKDLHVGDYVVAIGDSFAVGQAATLGIVSALGRSGLGIENYENFIQTDASINPGNSGGALVDLTGRLVGINTAILSRGSGNVGVGFAIPVDMAERVANQLVDNGKVERGELGVITQDLTLPLSRALRAGVTGGAVVSDVRFKSAAERAGLKNGDVITAIDGSTVANTGELHNAIGGLAPGAPVRLSLIRDGSPMKLSATLGAPKESKLAKGEVVPISPPNDPLAGAMLDIPPKDSTKRKAGVVVAAVGLGSEAEISGLKQGDIIESANNRPVQSPDELKRILHAQRDGTPVLLRVKRGDAGLFVPIG